MKNKVQISLAVSLLLSTSLMAQSNYSLDSVKVVESVSSTRSISQNDAFSAPESSKLTTDTLTQEEIAITNPKNVFEAINQTAAANVQFQGRKNSAIITFRGSTALYSGSGFGVILDGALLSPMSSLRILESLSIDIIDSIEVIRDATALTLGPIANFGTPNGAPNLGYIIIKTKLPKENGGSAKIAYESFNTKKANLNYGGIEDKIFYQASINGLMTEGKEDFNTAQENGSVFLRSGYIGEDFSATLSAYYSKAYQEIQRATDSTSMLTTSYWKYEPIENEFVSAIFEKDWNTNNRTTMQLSHSRTLWTHDMDTNSPSELPAVYFKGSQSTDSLDIRHSIKAGENIFKVGAQALFYDAPDGELFYEGYERKEQIYGAFVHGSHAFMDNKLMIDESVRIDKKHIDSLLERYSPDVTLTLPVTKLNNAELSIIENTWAKDSLALSLGGLYKFDDTLEATLRFAYLTSGTAESALSADGSAMQDEVNYRYEAGLKKSVNQFFNPTATLFLYDSKNIKSPLYEGTNLNPFIVFHQVDQKRYGGELAVEGQAEELYYSFTYAYATADIKDNEIPKHILSALFQKSLGKFVLNLSGKYISEYESNFFTVDKKYHNVGDFTVVNASVDYNHKLLGNDAKLSVYGRNILNDNYMTVIGYEDQGAVVGASYAFKF